MSLVAGYDSDSDNEIIPTNCAVQDAVHEWDGAKAQGTSASLPAEGASSSRPGGKRKAERLQIRVQNSIDGEEPAEKKRTKVSGNVASGPNQTTRHGLFSVLPAPTHDLSEYARKDVPVEPNAFGLASDKGGDDGKLTLVEDVIGKHAAKKTKGNADFRAMLGLAPSKKESATKKAEGGAQASGANIPKSITEVAEDTSSKGRISDIFALPAKADTITHEAKLPEVISAAPAVHREPESSPTRQDDEVPSDEEAYKGWQQGSDGSWFPVTPEAHAQYAAHLAAQSQREAEERQKMKRQGFDVHQARTSSQTFDVNERVSDAKEDASNLDRSALDKRYALAAASLATSGVRVDLSGLEQDDDSNADKSKNLRAKRKGQLSSLIAQADESKERLEERWSRGRAARAEAQKRYGF
jgi:hypothetical protein